MGIDWHLVKLRFQLYVEHIVTHGPIPAIVLELLAAYSVLSAILTVIVVATVIWAVNIDLKNIDTKNEYKPWHRVKGPNSDIVGLITGSLFFASGRIIITVLGLLIVMLCAIPMKIITPMVKAYLPNFYIYIYNFRIKFNRIFYTGLLWSMGIEVNHYDYNDGNPIKISSKDVLQYRNSTSTIAMNHVSIWDVMICHGLSLKIRHPHYLMRILGTSNRTEVESDDDTEYVPSDPLVIFPEKIASSGHTLLPFLSDSFDGIDDSIRPVILVYESEYSETYQWDYLPFILSFILTAADIRQKYVKVYWLADMWTDIEFGASIQEQVRNVMSSAMAKVQPTWHKTVNQSVIKDRAAARNLVGRSIFSNWFSRSNTIELKADPEGAPLLGYDETEDYMTYHDIDNSGTDM